MNTYSYKPIVISFILTRIIFFVHPSKIPQPDYIQNTMASTSNLGDDRFQPKPKFVHAIIIDAGSTGSRAFAFKFIQYPDDTLELTESVRYGTKPGLSGFAEHPDKATQSISGLLNKVKENFILEKYWHETKLWLRATAGLRQLEENKSQDILNNLKQLFEDVEFVTNDESVGIMEGGVEGVFAWFTVNILQKNIFSNILDQTTAVIDLGGGSVQITYIPTTKNHDQASIHQYRIMDQTINLFSKSYAKMGLMSGREGTYTKKGSGEFDFTSPCLHNEAKEVKYTFGPTTFNVSGEATDQGINYEKCLKTIESYIESSEINVKEYKELRYHKIGAISFFFGCPSRARVIQGRQAEITVKLYYDHAEIECSKEYEEADAFKCLDFLYMAVLLEKGFNIPRSNKIHLLANIGDHEVTWALGAAYHLLMPGAEQTVVYKGTISK